ncbi:MAG TPA: Z1 domain-containing protein, partial [Terriglobales bacterium]|nr:Z1 domain-containing protein [Terriglobales bacterium]
SCAAHQRQIGLPLNGGYKFLCHTSPKTSDHVILDGLIRRALQNILDDLPNLGANMPSLRAAHAELLRSQPQAPGLEELVPWISRYLPTRTMLQVNSIGSRLTFGRHLNFVVGGNILGRGLTIDNLLVTYYLRRARTTQMDTMLQHARMYGYRQPLMPYTRVFLPLSLATRFHHIHEAEQALRGLLRSPVGTKPTPVELAQNLVATRSTILDGGALAAYRPGLSTPAYF